MRSLVLLVAALVVVAAGPAEARHRHHHHARQASLGPSGCVFDNNGHQVCGGAVETYGRSNVRERGPIETASYDDGRIVGHPAGCPHTAFCGCGVSVKVFGHPVRNLYLAANWLKYPRAAPGPGMVAARHGHVMYIESINVNGNAVVYDPNSGGHQTRVHTRSLAGYHVVNPHSG